MTSSYTAQTLTFTLLKRILLIGILLTRNFSQISGNSFFLEKQSKTTTNKHKTCKKARNSLGETQSLMILSHHIFISKMCWTCVIDAFQALIADQCLCPRQWIRRFCCKKAVHWVLYGSGLRHRLFHMVPGWPHLLEQTPREGRLPFFWFLPGMASHWTWARSPRFGPRPLVLNPPCSTFVNLTRHCV